MQFAGLMAELIGVGAVGKLGHNASPHRAWARAPARLKTVQYPAAQHTRLAEGDSVLPADPAAPSRATAQRTAGRGQSFLARTGRSASSTAGSSMVDGTGSSCPSAMPRMV